MRITLHRYLPIPRSLRDVPAEPMSRRDLEAQSLLSRVEGNTLAAPREPSRHTNGEADLGDEAGCARARQLDVDVAPWMSDSP